MSVLINITFIATGRFLKTWINQRRKWLITFVTPMRNKVKLSFCNGLQFLLQAEDNFLKVGKCDLCMLLIKDLMNGCTDYTIYCVPFVKNNIKAWIGVK